MANIKLQRGNLSNIQNASLEDGTLSIAKDTKQILLDNNDNRTIVGEANYIKSVTYPATVDSNGALSINNATVSNDGLMSKEDKSALSNAAVKPKCITITLTVSGWSADTPYTQTVTASGVTTTNIVIPSPSPDCYESASSAGVYCSAQATNSLTFTCKKKPTQDLTYNVVIQEV